MMKNNAIMYEYKKKWCAVCTRTIFMIHPYIYVCYVSVSLIGRIIK